MSSKRKVEIFTAGCPACEETINLVNKIACSSCEISVLDMHDTDIAAKAKALGIKRIPTVVINGKLAACCTDSGANQENLFSEGIGNAIKE